jgi:iron-sulfur cluster assembly protein
MLGRYVNINLQLIPDCYMPIQISSTAAREIERLKFSRQQTDCYLRLGVKHGGCSGLSYILALESEFDLHTTSSYQSQGIEIVIDRRDESLLQDLNLDYSEDLMGGAFRFQNPKATATCSCGQSFAIE